MATKTITVDDITGAESTDDNPVGTVPFAYAGKAYLIDLSETSQTALAELLAPYITAAREVRPERAPRGTAPRGTAPRGTGDAKAAREWLRSHGYDVADKGKLSGDLWDAYRSGVPGAQASAQGAQASAQASAQEGAQVSEPAAQASAQGAQAPSQVSEPAAQEGAQASAQSAQEGAQSAAQASAQDVKGKRTGRGRAGRERTPEPAVSGT